jgi:hypothetical protein
MQGDRKLNGKIVFAAGLALVVIGSFMLLSNESHSAGRGQQYQIVPLQGIGVIRFGDDNLDVREIMAGDPVENKYGDLTYPDAGLAFHFDRDSQLQSIEAMGPEGNPTVTASFAGTILGTLTLGATLEEASSTLGPPSSQSGQPPYIVSATWKTQGIRVHFNDSQRIANIYASRNAID